MQKYLLAFVVGLVISGGGTPLARRLAVALGAVDEPDSRRANLSPTPRLGGLAVFLATGAALTAVALWDDRAAGALFANHPMALAGIAAITIVTVVGAVDDVHSLSARVKLAAELCAGAIAFAGGFRIEEVFGISLGALSLPVSMLWMATIANAFNLIDGLDGLAAGTGVIVGITLGLLSLEIGNVGSALLLSALCGALSGFLPYNIRRAKLFLGDSGALLVGTLIALCSIQTSNKLATGVAFLIPALAMGFPLGEVALTVMRRTLRALRVTRLDDRGGRYAFLKRGSSALFTPDRDHIHHRLLQLGFTTRRAVLVLPRLRADAR
jgi:UDP-GlcNAc:undecaprenyl-phosphate GlcNAc-1-phosphate transferase